MALAQLQPSIKFWSLCSLMLTTAASAQVGMESRISQVTLYEGSATVQRIARVKPGLQKFSFTCLPAQLQVSNLNVSADAGVQIGELSVLTEEREATSCPGSGLDGRIRELEDKKAALIAEDAAWGLVKGYLQNLSGPTPTPTAASADPKQISALMDSLYRTGRNAMTQQAQLQRQIKDVEQQLSPLMAQSQHTQASRARVTRVSVMLDSPKDAEIRLSYHINGPGWAPTYRAMLDTHSRQLRLERRAEVAQATGEDWSDVGMTLSTGQPSTSHSAPNPSAWHIGLMPPPTQDRAQRAMMAAPAPAAAPAQSKNSANQEQSQAPLFQIGMFEGSFATTFKVAQRIDVPTNGQRVTLALGEQTIPARLHTRTTPLEDATAWLVADMAAPTGVWPAGRIQLYRDGTYVGHDTLNTGSNSKWTLTFGRDDLVRVQVNPTTELQGSGGLISNRTERRISHSYTIENRHTTPVHLQVLEAAPISTHEQVQVSTEFNPAPETQNWNEQPGIVMWSRELNAGNSARFTANYTLSWPQQSRLQESR